ncbi:STAS domain-containing protein [Streptomyces sp. NPDC002935]|uniref:STAS domain-containing protein n=1 Tax=unclassified Streptomyces TaxID=2593676 RepID=UPI00332D2353
MTDVQPAQSGHFSVNHSTVGGVRVVTVCGELDHLVRDRLGEALNQAADDAPPRTVADLTGVTFMDSSGINALIGAHRAATDAQGWIRLAGAQQSVLRVMQLVGIDELIPCYPTVSQALES